MRHWSWLWLALFTLTPLGCDDDGSQGDPTPDTQTQADPDTSPDDDDTASADTSTPGDDTRGGTTDAADSVSDDDTADVSDTTPATDVTDTASDDVNDDDTGADATDTGDAASADTVEPTDTADATDTAPGPDGDVCSEAIDVTAGGVFDNESTVTASDDYDAGLGNPGCPVGAATGRDRVYAVSPATDTSYRILVEPNEATFDPMIYARLDCSAEACIDGTVLNGPGTREQLDITVTGGQTAYIIVDGENVSQGTYTLTVTLQ